MSEEFLRKYQEEGEAVQTVDDAVPIGHELFEDTGGKREHNIRQREKTGGQREYNVGKDDEQS